MSLEHLKTLSDKQFLAAGGFRNPALYSKDSSLEELQERREFVRSLMENPQIRDAKGIVPDEFFLEEEDYSFSAAATIDPVKAAEGANPWSNSSKPSMSKKKKPIIIGKDFFSRHFYR